MKECFKCKTLDSKKYVTRKDGICLCLRCYQSFRDVLKKEKRNSLKTPLKPCSKCGKILKINRKENPLCAACGANDWYHTTYKYISNSIKYKLRDARAVAKRRDLEWSIDEGEYQDIISRGCFYCQKVLTEISGGNLDRINTKKGYIPNNVLGCCPECNQIRMNNLTVLETKKAVESVKLHRKSLPILLIDDCRNIAADVICRTYEEGIEALKHNKFSVLFLDHDLASFDEGGREKTGYDVLCFLEANPELLPKRIELVTSNPVGRQNMKVVIEKLYGDKQ